MKKKKLARPAWWKSSYFWITGILVVIALYGFLFGPWTITDPGQTNSGPADPDNARRLAGGVGLPLLYLAAAIVMGVNAMLSHRQYVAQYNAEREHEEKA